MLRVGLYVRLEAKAGRENDLAGFLEQGLRMAHEEVGTPVWFAVRFGPTTFAIFDAFADEAGRQAHLEGPIAAALMANAEALLASAPTIERYDVIGAKLPG
ncbi:MAG: antibiotic biosynthesis monooxygenase [Sandaracinaceae bacterium]|nr:antibiotic biosynthesis monooxygenase [Sandaracinaceae bacterium]